MSFSASATSAAHHEEASHSAGRTRGDRTQAAMAKLLVRPISTPVSVPFPALLVQHARAAHLALPEFAVRIQWSESKVRQVAMGMRPPPLDRLDRWADTLGLGGESREQFVQAAHLANAPEMVREMVEQLERRVRELEDRLGHVG